MPPTKSSASQQRSSTRAGFTILCLLLLTLSLLTTTVVSIFVSNEQYAILDLSREEGKLEEENEALKLEMWSLSSMDALNKKAEEFGMVPVDSKK